MAIGTLVPELQRLQDEFKSFDFSNLRLMLQEDSEKRLNVQFGQPLDGEKGEVVHGFESKQKALVVLQAFYLFKRAGRTMLKLRPPLGDNKSSVDLVEEWTRYIIEGVGSLLVVQSKYASIKYIDAIQQAALVAIDRLLELAYKQLSGSDDIMEADGLVDGLDRSKGEFVWCGGRYEWLTETMMDALQVLHKAYRDDRKVWPDEMENIIGSLPDGGFFKVFKVDRAGWPSTHPVRAIVGGRANSGWYLIEKNSSQT
jgi:hypothetical protein